MVVLREEVRSRLVALVLNISETTTKTETETDQSNNGQTTKPATEEEREEKRASRVIRTITVREGKSRLKPGGRDETGRDKRPWTRGEVAI